MAARAPPPLMDDLVTDILLRLPPHDIACLLHASLVCKAWRRLLTDHAFLRRYRAIHGGSHVLGFLYNNYSTGASGPLFLPTTQPSPFSPPAASAAAGRPTPTYCRTLNCRHGRVLLFHPDFALNCPYTSRFTVWDPVTGKERCFSTPVNPHVKFMAAVLCACSASNGGCDHIGCSGGPFIVVLVARREESWLAVAQAQASLYSSETGKWTAVSASIDFDSFTGTTTPSLLSGDALFFLGSRGILKNDLTRGVLSAIRVPPIHPVENMVLCTAEDGGLGVATVDGCSLRMLSGRTDPDGVTRWVQDRAVELDSIIPVGVGGASTKFYVIGFAEGTGYIFVRANDSIFRVEVKSGRISKIGSGKFGPIFPLMGFYIPDLASARLQRPMKIE